MKNSARLLVLCAALVVSSFASANEMEGTLQCKGSIRGVSLQTTLMLKKLSTPRNPNNPSFFDVELTLDGSEYSKNTFTAGAGIEAPSRMKMDFFSCTERTHDPKMTLFCGGFYRAPGVVEGNRETLSPFGISVDLAYKKDGSITAKAIVTKREQNILGMETTYVCKQTQSDALED